MLERPLDRGKRAARFAMALTACCLRLLSGDSAGAQAPKIVFLPHLDYATGTIPTSVAIGDVNGDGKLDLVVANAGSGTVSVLLGDGTGRFGPARDFPVAAGPQAVAIGDLNGDGKPDLVTANSGMPPDSASLSILLGDGVGGFGSPTNIHGGLQYPSFVAITDLNRDGHADLVVANTGGDDVTVFLGNGTGAFGPRIDSPTTGAPYWIAIGDMNTEGRLDVVAATPPDSVTVLLGDGLGGLGHARSFLTGELPSAVAIGDFNNDGQLDVATANSYGNSVSILLGNGRGGLSAKTDFAAGPGPQSIAVADLNGDGRLDVVTSSDSVWVLLGDGVGALGPKTGFSTGGSTRRVAVADLNADGKLDIVAVTSTTVSVLIQTSARGTRTDITSDHHPWVYGQTVVLSSVVTSAVPGNPTGSVQFFDGVALLGTALLVSGQATLGVSSLPLGTNPLTAVYSGDSNFDGSTSPILSQQVLPLQTIASVEDVQRDQGREVRLRILPNGFDAPGSSFPIVRYDVFRRIDASAATRAMSANGARGDSPEEPAAPTRSLLAGWDAVASMGAYADNEYDVVVPTLADSDATGIHESVFLVRAATAQPTVFFDSAPDSGYSLDNLPPPTPAPFTAVYGSASTALHWETSGARDFYEFRLYRGPEADFVPGPGNLILATRDTGYVDAAGTPYVYKLSAVDVHGNESHFAVVTPNGVEATLASVTSVDARPDRIRLEWLAVANPGITATVYRRTAETDWSPIGTIVADSRGYLRYEDLAVVAGSRYGYRLGILDGGAEIFAGEAWATAELLELALEGTRPNPALGGRLAVFFSLPTAAEAELQLIDVGGRSVASRLVGSLGPGEHSVEIADGVRMPPGIYFVRLTQAGRSLTRRVALLP